MAVKIIQFHVWLRSYPKSEWTQIREDLYSVGRLPEDAEKKWRLVRIVSGSGAKLGVVKAEEASHIGFEEILWLSRCRRGQEHHYYMRTTSGWAGNVRNVIRYYREDYCFGGGTCSHILGGLPERGSPF